LADIPLESKKIHSSLSVRLADQFRETQKRTLKNQRGGSPRKRKGEGGDTPWSPDLHFRHIQKPEMEAGERTHLSNQAP